MCGRRSAIIGTDVNEASNDESGRKSCYDSRVDIGIQRNDHFTTVLRHSLGRPHGPIYRIGVSQRHFMGPPFSTSAADVGVNTILFWRVVCQRRERQPCRLGYSRVDNDQSGMINLIFGPALAKKKCSAKRL